MVCWQSASSCCLMMLAQSQSVLALVQWMPWARQSRQRMGSSQALAYQALQRVSLWVWQAPHFALGLVLAPSWICVAVAPAAMVAAAKKR
jgi:hypothetical protein